MDPCKRQYINIMSTDQQPPYWARNKKHQKRGMVPMFALFPFRLPNFPSLLHQK